MVSLKACSFLGDHHYGSLFFQTKSQRFIKMALLYLFGERMPIPGKMYVWEERAKYVPDEAGVYALYNEDKVLIYVGGSDNLRETFTHYLETNFHDGTRISKL